MKTPQPPSAHSSVNAPSDPIAGRPLQVQRIGLDQLDLIRRINVAIFDEERIINTFDRDDLLMLVAQVNGKAAGFKVGYRLRSEAFYSAKGGVLPAYRREGVARALLYAMIDQARAWGYQTFLYDTFPNQHPGMTVLGLAEGFRVVKAGYSPQYKDYRLRFQKEL